MNKPNPIQSPELTWQEDLPVSAEFDDVYFSKAGGIEETHYVFLEHNALEKRFSSLTKNSQFTIGETGFGTGLNFLCAVQLWLKTAPDEYTLHYLSYEKFPLDKEQLKRAHTGFTGLESLSDALIETYPPLIRGIHNLTLFQGRVRLTLYFDDIHDALPLTNANVDAWFLDGFSPAKNPDMWTPLLFSQLARLSQAATTLATFTAAGFVKRGLIEAGFTIKKDKGYGQKRDMLYGEFIPQAPKPKFYKDKPWFTPPPKNTTAKSAIIIGGGLAGCQLAYHLSKHFNITLIEKETQLAQHASGNRAGVLYGKVSASQSAQYRFHEHAYLDAINDISRIMPNWEPCGTINLAFNDKEIRWQNDMAQNPKWPSSHVSHISAEEASELSGATCHHNGIYFPHSGYLRPSELCKELISQCTSPINTITGKKVTQLSYENQQWHVAMNTDTLVSDIVVIANAQFAAELAQTDHLPLKTIRGQVSHVPSSEESRLLRTVICHQGYITPAENNEHAVGATFNLKDPETALRQEDHNTNFANLHNALPALQASLNTTDLPVSQGRVGFRTQTPDYLPIIGPVADTTAYQHAYQTIASGMQHVPLKEAPYLPNLYASLAHGSKGLTTTGIAAKIILSYIQGTPMPVDKGVLEAIHPARFTVRDLKRNKKPKGHTN